MKYELASIVASSHRQKPRRTALKARLTAREAREAPTDRKTSGSAPPGPAGRRPSRYGTLSSHGSHGWRLEVGPISSAPARLSRQIWGGAHVPHTYTTRIPHICLMQRGSRGTGSYRVTDGALCICCDARVLQSVMAEPSIRCKCASRQQWHAGRRLP
jgi:hypothetical protein